VPNWRSWSEAPERDHGGDIRDQPLFSVPRSIVLFFSAYLINNTLHELSHALTAYVLGVPSTLYHFYVDVDRAHAGAAQQAWIGVAGPLCSLLVGTACWLVYTRARATSRALPFLYLATFGISMFLGNLFSASFVGDFSRAATALNVPMAVRYGVTATGALCLAAVMFVVGQELLHWAPPQVSAMRAIVALVVSPVVVGTGCVLVAYLPVPAWWIVGLGLASVFWIFAAVGVCTNARRPRGGGERDSIRWPDAALALVALVVVRGLVVGVPFVP
jgi:hypothetical protein